MPPLKMTKSTQQPPREPCRSTIEALLVEESGLPCMLTLRDGDLHPAHIHVFGSDQLPNTGITIQPDMYCVVSNIRYDGPKNQKRGMHPEVT